MVSLSVLQTHHANATTEFIVTVNNGAAEDYNTFTLAEAALDDAGDLTDGTVKCGNWDTQVNSDIGDAVAVTWDSGSSSGTLIHMTNANGSGAGDQYLIDVSAGTLADNDTVSDGTNTFDVAGTPDDCIIVMQAHDDDGKLTETASFNIDGFTTDATNYVKLTVHEDERHSGVESTGSDETGFNMVGDGNTEISINDDYTIIEWIQHSDGNGQSAVGSGTGTVGGVLRNVIIRDFTSSRAAIRTWASSTSQFSIMNTLIYNVSGDGNDDCIQITQNSSNSWYKIYNTTVYNCDGHGYERASSATTVMEVYNSVACGSGASDFDNDISSSSDNLASCDDTADDTTPTTSYINETDTDLFTSVTGGSEDFTPKSGSNLIDNGTDLVDTPSGVGIDLKGRDRDAEADTWDIGAIEVVAAAPSTNRIIFISDKSKELNCYDDDFIVPQEAGKCKVGNRWSRMLKGYWDLGLEDPLTQIVKVKGVR